MLPAYPRPILYSQAPARAEYKRKEQFYADKF
nr:MAG TPA: hypothetical protein [Caudoviricetes sp.]DAG68118.1 MAG TPA: hypothetical protein [Caudoviricetes sp.]DAI07670.1 MAG TPA: hypothetical protein [Bacteriophage sp.]DAT68501.1 MAG TPA: hypothetical protein [Caudoviricetes sp.]DAY29191.1 MAG TPA: hypothetical protein [Caudoviricetes sp.]